MDDHPLLGFRGPPLPARSGSPLREIGSSPSFFRAGAGASLRTERRSPLPPASPEARAPGATQFLLEPISSPALPVREEEHLHEYAHYGHRANDETSSDSDSGDESQSAGQSATELSHASEQPLFSNSKLPPQPLAFPAQMLALVREAAAPTSRASACAASVARGCVAPPAVLVSTPLPACSLPVPPSRVAVATAVPELGVQTTSPLRASVTAATRQHWPSEEAALDVPLAESVVRATAAVGDEASAGEAGSQEVETDSATGLRSHDALAREDAPSVARDTKCARTANAALSLHSLRSAFDAATTRCNHVHGAVSELLLASDRERLGTVALAARRRRPSEVERCSALANAIGARALTVRGVLDPVACTALVSAARSIGFAPWPAVLLPETSLAKCSPAAARVAARCAPAGCDSGAACLVSGDATLARLLWSRIAPFVPTVYQGRRVLGLPDQLRYIQRSSRAARAAGGARGALHFGIDAAAADGATVQFLLEVCLASEHDDSALGLRRGDARLWSGDSSGLAAATAAAAPYAICVGIQFGEVSGVAQLREAMGLGGAPSQVRRRLTVACCVAAALLGGAAAMWWLQRSNTCAEKE